MTLVDPGITQPDDSPNKPADRSRPAATTEPTETPDERNQLERPSLRVVPWRDAVVDSRGLDPRSWYVEQFWLPIVGPTCTWFLRRAAARFEGSPEGFRLELDDMARALGLGARQGRHAPFARALARCITFELAKWQGRGTLAVRRTMPPLSQRYVQRLPPGLQEGHRRWLSATRRPVPSPSFEEHRDRARRLALGLVALGEAFDRAEAQLLRWGLHPSLTTDAVAWARRMRLPGGGGDTDIGDGDGAP
jgi:hypothetical protein